ncbi:MAG: hypothetical protein M1379_02505 [Firmicutes bacterium]|nr:hypothetical protein [Bacillota bacterium]
MRAESIDKIQGYLDWMTRRWWFLSALALANFLIPSYVPRAYQPQEIPGIIEAVLSNPLIYKFPALMVLAKLIPIALIAAVVLLGGKAARLFDLYAAVLLFALALFQNMAFTEKYGFVILWSNVVSIMVVAIFWAWEAIAAKNDFTATKQPLWSYWVIPAAFLAFWFPVETSSITPKFSILELFTNEAGLTLCMMLPVFLAVLSLYYPNVNRATFRVTSFVGMIFGSLNLVTWFLLKPSMWWMGVLHLPLFGISIHAFSLSMTRPGRAASGAAGIDSGRQV